MPIRRVRPKLSVTLDPESIESLEILIKRGKVKNAGEAIDLVCNLTRLYCPDVFGMKNDDHKVVEHIEKLKRKKEHLKELFETTLEDIFNTETELHMIGVRNQLVEATPEVAKAVEILSAPRAAMKLEYDWEQLLERCRERTPHEIEDWAKEGDWLGYIEDTGHTLEEFIEEKMKRVGNIQMTKATERPQVDYDGLARAVADKMNEHWRNVKGGGMKSPDATRFYVAFQVQRFNKALASMDNGHKAEMAANLFLVVNQMADDRKFPRDDVMAEFQSIYERADDIVAETTAKLKVK